jgi:hypothetical protein
LANDEEGQDQLSRHDEAGCYSRARNTISRRDGGGLVSGRLRWSWRRTYGSHATTRVRRGARIIDSANG